MKREPSPNHAHSAQGAQTQYPCGFPVRRVASSSMRIPAHTCQSNTNMTPSRPHAYQA